MHSRALTSTSRQALFAVFVRPTLAPPAIAFLQQPQPCFPQTPLPFSKPFLHARNLNVYRRVTRAKPAAFSDIFIVDEKIGSLRVQLVDEENRIQPVTALQDLLHSIDRSTDCLRKVDESADGIPVVKIVAKSSLQKEAVLKVSKDRKETKSEESLTKQVELTWAITENDLGYRLARLESFLREGRRVEVLIAPKRGARRVTRVEEQALLKKIRDIVGEIEGASEWKRMDGIPGREVVLYFQSNELRERAKEAQKVKAKEVQVEKFEKKERDKAEKQARLEKRMARKQEYEERKKKLMDEIIP